VARGAAALAASAAGGGDPVAVATRWNAAAEDAELPAVERDTEAWDRIGSVLDRASAPLLGG
ncbi:MAG TPA: xylulokinase, partial [Streptomyces sp.]|nr:xylulokinase [Streptomyces sp.]